MTLPCSAAPTTSAVSRATDLGSAALLADVERRLSEGQSVALVVEAPAVAPELLTSHQLSLAANLRPSVFWHGAGSSEDLDRLDETTVGLGVVQEVTAPWGDTEVLRRFADEQLGCFHVVGCSAADVRPRIFAAVGFSPTSSKGDIAPDVWTDFGGAWGVIPRLAYVHRRARARQGLGDEAWLCLCLTPPDLSHLESLLAQLASFGRKLRSCTIEQGAPAAATCPAEETQLSDWRVWIDDALHAIEEQRFEKVVAARVARFTFREKLSVSHTLLSLAASHGDSTRFAFFRGESVFLGATPERLVGKQGRQVETEALAGTVRRREMASERDAALDFGPKEHKEHSPVLAQILAALAPFCSEVSYDASPRLRAQQHVLHLRTAVRGTLNSDYHVLSLVQALHPTPAVGGCPTADALAWIFDHEDFDRGFYAGPVGWVDSLGNGQFNVALRSGVLQRDRATLFAGAGIVAGSDPQREYDETALKLQVLLGSLCHVPAGAAG